MKTKNFPVGRVIKINAVAPYHYGDNKALGIHVKVSSESHEDVSLTLDRKQARLLQKNLAKCLDWRYHRRGRQPKFLE